MSLADVDAVLTAPKRLAIMGILRRVEEVDFVFIRDQLDFSDSDLSKQMAALGEAGYVTSRKTGRGGRDRPGSRSRRPARAPSSLTSPS